ncbi:MAG: hypothetical protein ACOX5E_04320 [Bacilli bacterium]
MKKLKSNRGITLPFTVVVMFFVALLIAALVGYVSLSYQLSTRQIRLAEHKIILENEMYDYIKNIDDIGYLNSLPLEADFNEKYYIKVKNEGNLIIELKEQINYPNVVLKAELEFTLENGIISYQIKKWGFN